jgi:hypothetical protein
MHRLNDSAIFLFTWQKVRCGAVNSELLNELVWDVTAGVYKTKVSEFMPTSHSVSAFAATPTQAVLYMTTLLFYSHR